jgi:hypothetical protein
MLQHGMRFCKLLCCAQPPFAWLARSTSCNCAQDHLPLTMHLDFHLLFAATLTHTTPPALHIHVACCRKRCAPPGTPAPWRTPCLSTGCTPTGERGPQRTQSPSRCLTCDQGHHGAQLVTRDGPPAFMPTQQPAWQHASGDVWGNTQALCVVSYTMCCHATVAPGVCALMCGQGRARPSALP